MFDGQTDFPCSISVALAVICAASVSGCSVSTAPGSAASAVHCTYCPAVLGGEEEMQEHMSSQHMSQSGKTFSCPLCPLTLISQMELQEHLLSCHVETAEEQEAEEDQASTSHTVRRNVVHTISSDRLAVSTFSCLIVTDTHHFSFQIAHNN